MANTFFKKHTESLVREWEVPSGTQPFDIVVHAVSGEVGFALTARGDSTLTLTNIPGINSATIDNGGVGNQPNGAAVAVDGSIVVDINDATNGKTLDGTGTPEGTPVWFVDKHTVTTIDPTDSGANPPVVGIRVGVIDDGHIIDNRGPIKIGA